MRGDQFRPPPAGKSGVCVSELSKRGVQQAGQTRLTANDVIETRQMLVLGLGCEPRPSGIFN